MKRNLLIQTLCAGTGFALLAGPADAATIIDGTHVNIAQSSITTNDVNISLFPGTAGYSGPFASGAFGDGTVLDYRLVNATDGSLNGAGYANGGAGRVGVMTAADANVNTASINKLNVWESTNPNGFIDLSTRDLGAGNTMAAVSLLNGSVDISGLETGVLYFIYGSFVDEATVAVTMTGSGQPDLNESHTIDPPNPSSFGDERNQIWISSFVFDNAGGDYDTIDFTYTNADADGSRARFGGVILDGVVPEPGSLALLGLGGLLVASRRRRQN
jgi:hypothetical protein